MESEFITYLRLGHNHILDINGIDHLLFVIALCATYRLADWRKIAILVTAFTIGHSLTLGLAAMDIIVFPAQVIEWLVPVTILITAVYTLWNTRPPAKYLPNTSPTGGETDRVKYSFALFFGLIHGMAFSNFFKSEVFSFTSF